MAETLVHIRSEEIEREIRSFKAHGITEFTLQDEKILCNKEKLLHFIKTVSKNSPETLITLPVSAKMLDMEVCRAASEIFCSLEIPLECSSKGGTFLFDKKFYNRRAQMLNSLGLVFGFQMDFACVEGDSVKLFRDRLDFAVSLYPNHIDFPQIEAGSGKTPHNSATYSSQDIKNSSDTAFACSVFYSFGRAVPWFLSIIKPLKLTPSKFFADFAEWQKINNCSRSSKWNVLEATHKEIEMMQLLFLKFKYEEKNKIQLFDVVNDIVRLNGALSRCMAENSEEEIELFYSPEDLLSFEAQNLASFAENVMLNHCTVKVFFGEDGPDFRVIF